MLYMPSRAMSRAQDVETALPASRPWGAVKRVLVILRERAKLFISDTKAAMGVPLPRRDTRSRPTKEAIVRAETLSDPSRVEYRASRSVRRSPG